mmetsp:Transcript_52091/g.121131  ORF Transcript_52091/g.121131 Transcript_52091/m.121131 type:complete len:412 (-) Transcript_52091:132-1367(-)|eukprot:CAMPEP_0171093176 /NCGR_PEP_ID=MMETSP0766_2-20121228/38922_1 /TAXON_ID=439317 /ORGANISM="Gambierdiscus australes, Strain CAWD 149" /LENGTH=411 /DNA_ID=CAMNT_0011551573 /DNA_START=43 /DNA_END=1278 /DNA_ORIENTATION=-
MTMDRATRQAGPDARPWEYCLLDAIAKDSRHLVGLAVEKYASQINWEARVAELYGGSSGDEVYYLVSSFGLQWRNGLTLFETALFNDKNEAALAIDAAQRAVTKSLEPAAPENTVHVALVQCPSDLGAVAKNLARLERHVRTAAQRGAKIVVLPEASVTGYLSQDLQINWGLEGKPQSFPKSKDPTNYAEVSDGPSVRHMASLARELGLYITVPFLEREGQQFFNTVTLVGPESLPERPVLAHYRKNCPWPHPEKSWATPGDGVATFDTPYGRVGLAICFDIHSVLAKYADRGLWALLYPIAWVGDIAGWFARELPDRLAQVSCPHYVLGANWATDAPQKWSGAGGSSAYAPGGRLLAQALEPQFPGCTEVVLLTLPTQRSMPAAGPLDLERYSEWTRGQMGTDFWQREAR